MKGQKDPYDEGIRRPMEWCRDNSCPEMTSWYPVWNEEPDGISVEEEQLEPGSILNYIKFLIKLRKNNPVLETGEVEFLPVYLDADEKEEYKRAVAYWIHNDEKGVLIVANLHKKQELVIDLSDIDNIEKLKELGDGKFNWKMVGSKLEIVFPEKSTFFARILN